MELSDEFNVDWIKSVIENSLLYYTVIVMESCSDRSGWLSSRFKVKAIKKPEVNDQPAELNLFLKLLPPEGVPHREFVASNGLDNTEIYFYKSFFKDLKVFLSKWHFEYKVEVLCPKFYSGDCITKNEQRFSYLLMEDLSNKYSMFNFNDGLSFQQMQNAISCLAQFHATCYCYGKMENIKFEEKYHFLGSSQLSESSSILVESARHFLTDARKDADLADLVLYLEKWEDFKGMYGKYSSLMSYFGESFVIHGDVWSNNILFNSTNDCKFLDWQFFAVGNIFFDFGTLVFLHMSPEETEKNLLSFIEIFTAGFYSVCENLHCKVPYTKEEFSDFALKHGLALTMYWCVFSYDMVDSYPCFYDRIKWVFRKTVNFYPHVF